MGREVAKTSQKLSIKAPQRRHGHQSSPQVVTRPLGYILRLMPSTWHTPQMSLCQSHIHMALKVAPRKVDLLSLEIEYIVQ